MSTLNRALVSPVLIGRLPEMARLESALHSARQGTGRCVVVGGEAGVGKSRLLAQVRTLAGGEGFVTLEGHCFEQDLSFPYAPWIDALRAFFAPLAPADVADRLGPLAPELIKLLPELALSLPGTEPSALLDPEAEKRRRFEALIQLIMRLVRSGPLLVIVEDLHWSDEPSLELLHTFARRLAGRPILLMASYRGEEATPHLARTLAQLRRERQAEEIVLGPLAREQVAALVQAILSIGRPIHTDLLDLLVQLTEGNPFFIEEILKTLVAVDDIFIQDGHWERRSTGDLRVPQSIQDAVQRRAERLGAPAQSLLSLAAVAGRRFDFPLLQTVAGLDESRLLDILTELIDAQLVIEESPDRFAFRHALTRQAVYERLLARQRRAMHARIAETMEQVYARALDAHLPGLAYHFYEANVWEPAFQYARQAGEAAQRLYALREARDHFSRALDAARRVPEPPPIPQLLSLLQARSRLCETLGDFATALADGQAALDLARAGGSRRDEWQALLDLGFLWGYRDYRRGEGYVQQALDLARALGDRTLIAHSLNRLGNWHQNREHPFEARRLYREALAVYDDLGDRPGLAETLDLLGHVSYACGDLIQGAAYLQRAVALFHDLGDRRGEAQSLVMLPLRVWMSTEVLGTVHLDGLLEPAERALRLAQGLGWRGGEIQAHGRFVQCLTHVGDYARSIEHAQAGLAIGQEIGHSVWTAAGHWGLGTIYLELGALPEAQAHLEQALALAQQAGASIFVRQTTLGLVSVSILAGDLPRAEALLGPVPAALGEEGVAQREDLAMRAALALAQGRPAPALSIAEELISSAANIETYGRHAIPRLSLLRGRALTALGRFEEAAEELQVACQVAREQGRRPTLWRLQAALGHAYRAAHRPRQAENVFSAARSTIEELGATIPDAAERTTFLARATALVPPAPALSARQAEKQQFDGLTARERQVAALIAAGRSNREIAAELVISEKTAERHVANIMNKLDMHARSQIAAWAVEKCVA